MKDTVRAGLRYIHDHFHPSADDVWLLAPADLPHLSPKTIDAVLAAHEAAAPAIVAPRQGDRRGHPVLLPWPLAAEVEKLGEGAGVNQLLRRHSVREIVLPASPTELQDLDTPEDYERLRPRRSDEQQA